MLGAAVRKTFVDALDRRQERLEGDGRLLAEDAAISRAVAQRRRRDLARLVIPFGIRKELDYVAVHERSGRVLFINGRTAWAGLPVARGFVAGGRHGLKQRGAGVGHQGEPALFAAVPVRARGGIVGVLVAGRALDRRILAEVGSPLGAELALQTALEVRHGQLRQSASDARLAGRTYAFPLPLSRASHGRARLLVGLSTAPLDRARRQALFLGLVAGVLLALALTALLGGLLRRRVVVPLEGLRAALRRVKTRTTARRSR